MSSGHTSGAEIYGEMMHGDGTLEGESAGMRNQGPGARNPATGGQDPANQAEDRLAQIERILPPPPPPAANYLPVREACGMLYVAGQTPHVNGELRLRGRVGETVTAEDARALARDAALGAVSVLRAYLGDLREVGAIVSLTGFVACAPAFAAHPWVVDGASELLIECFGEAGRHARAAVGVQSLPDGAPVEVSVIAMRRSAD